MKEFPLIVKITFGLIFIILFFYSIIVAKHLLMVLTLAILFSYLLFPLVARLEMIHFPRFLANLVAILLLLAIFSGVIFLMYKQVETLLDDLPLLKRKALDNIDQLEVAIESWTGLEVQKQHLWLKENVNNLFESGSNFLKVTFTATTSTIVKMLLLPVFIYYMLFYRQKFFIFLLRIIPKDKKTITAQILKKISQMVQRYIGGVFIVVLVLSIINSLGLYSVGLKYPIIFGIISAFFNFIPYFGTWIGASIPFVFALLTGDSINLAVGVLILFAIIQFTENNILTPNITGGYVDINPLITILSIIVGGMVWGVVGMFIVLPVMATIKIICEYTPQLHAVAYLISNQQERKYLVRKRRFYLVWNRMKARYRKTFGIKTKK
ncbi:MAG: AI-2E family transporter [Bacteroidales bacterium]|nr:AI-2E family transporter [Bacteroidales bacterium]MCF8333935.1 AI-2E family transporter [Bacteroidales bacterium]